MSYTVVYIVGLDVPDNGARYWRGSCALWVGPWRYARADALADLDEHMNTEHGTGQIRFRATRPARMRSLPVPRTTTRKADNGR